VREKNVPANILGNVNATVEIFLLFEAATSGPVPVSHADVGQLKEPLSTSTKTTNTRSALDNPRIHCIGYGEVSYKGWEFTKDVRGIQFVKVGGKEATNS
jgi:hypothetical protein